MQYNKKIVIGNSIVFAWIIMTIFSDLNSVNKQYLFVFIITKILIGVASLSLLINSFSKKFNHKLGNRIFLIISACYCVFGEMFCPGYHLAYIQVVITTVLVYETSKKFVLYYLGLFFVTYTTVFHWFNFNTVKVSGYESYYLDIQVAILSVSVLAVGLYLHIKKFKDEKEYLESKFLNLGNQSATIVHDIKSQLIPPLNYVKMLKGADLDDSSKEEILNEMSICLNSMKEYILEVNQMVAFKQQKGYISIHEIVEKIKRIFESKLKNIKISIHQTDDFFSEETTVFKSLVYNLLTNSAQAFNSNHITDKKVFIELSSHCFEYRDNAGGIPEEVLNKIKNNDFFTTKAEGSGLGFYFISRYVEHGKYSMELENIKNGMCLKIKFK